MRGFVVQDLGVTLEDRETHLHLDQLSQMRTGRGKGACFSNQVKLETVTLALPTR
jgi:hypothetical protein